jgi:hypothetical protein
MSQTFVFILLILFFTHPAEASLQRKEFENILQTFQHIKQDLMPKEDKLLFNPKMPGDLSWWDLPSVSAKYEPFLSEENILTHIVFIHGGLAREPYMPSDEMARIICHELGHGLAGPPLKTNGVSVEALADSYSVGRCLKIFFQHSPLNKPLPEDTEISLKCSSIYSKSVDELKFCIRALNTVKIQQEFFLQKEKTTTHLFGKDPFIAKSINRSPYYYPSAQCRIETEVNTILGEPLPSCWFVKKSSLKK